MGKFSLRSMFCLCCCFSFLREVLGVTYQPLTKIETQEEEGFFLHNYRPEIFYDNRVLPEDLEVQVHFYKEHVKRVFFLVEKDASPVSITITPCLAPVEWRLLLRTLPTAHQNNVPWHNQIPRQNSDSNKGLIENSYFGNERQTYFQNKMSIGLYVLEIDSKGIDTSISIYFTTTNTNKVLPYPKLPDDVNVRILKSRRESLTISWKSILYSNQLKSENIEYCLSLNENRNYGTMCAYLTSLNGEMPPTPPPSSGFGFSWEKNDKKKLSIKHREAKKQKVIDNNNKKSIKSGVGGAIFECIGDKTRHTFEDLKNGQKYFLDVFVVNKLTNKSSSYKSLSFLTRNVYNDFKIRFNKLITINLTNQNEYTSNMKFIGSIKNPSIWIFVQSCSGPGEIQLKITEDLSKKVILETLFMDSRTLTLRDVRNGSYTLTLRSVVQTERRARLWLSRKQHKYPFPSLPEDRKIKALETLSTCDSITLVWKTTDKEKVCYCLYKKNVLVDTTTTSSSSSSSTSPDDLKGLELDVERYQSIVDGPCEITSEREDKNLVLCRRYHRFSKHRFNNIIMQKVRGLRPATAYVFDVKVTKLRGKTLAYDSIWVTTKGNCSKIETKR